MVGWNPAELHGDYINHYINHIDNRIFTVSTGDRGISEPSTVPYMDHFGPHATLATFDSHLSIPAPSDGSGDCFAQVVSPSRNHQPRQRLGGGNAKIFYFYPEPWGNDPIWLILGSSTFCFCKRRTLWRWHTHTPMLKEAVRLHSLAVNVAFFFEGVCSWDTRDQGTVGLNYHKLW